MGEREKETIVAEIERSAKQLLQWAKGHPRCALRE
jgi:hypothetical protein